MNSSDLFRQFLDAGMQFTQLTQRRAEAIVQDLVKAGEVQAEQAQATVTEIVDRSRANSEKFFEQLRGEIRQQLKVLGVATKADLAKVEKKVSAPAPSPTVTAPKVASPATVKAAAKKTTAKKTTAKKTAAKKTAAKKTTAKRTTAKRTTAKKTTAKRSAAKKSASGNQAPFTRTPASDAS